MDNFDEFNNTTNEENRESQAPSQETPPAPEQLQNTEQNYRQAPPPYPYGVYPPPNGYPYPPMQPQYPQQDRQNKKKRLNAVWTAVIIAIIAVMFVIIVILSVVVAKRASELFEMKKSESSFSSLETQTASEKKDKDEKRVQITLPTSPRPVLEAKYYADEETGLLTTEGVAQKVMPSQVLIGVYSDTPYKMTSLGSGIIISSDGYILTNAHVVDEDAQFKAQLNDGRQFEAKLVGIDRKQDLAVVKIEANDLISAEIGNSDNVILGEQVAVIGAGGSLENSITFGYVSALGREIETDYSSSGTLRCIQTDAALNPGNSGGALVNMYGQVIGISVGGLDHVVYDGIGFAIEINDAVPVAEALIANGYVPGRAKLGIVFVSMDSATADSLGVESGLCVMSVDPTCDIATKGLQPYDIITKIDGHPVKDLASVMEVLDEKIAGEEVTLTVYRKTVTEEVTTFEVTARLEQKLD
ncbi:MAG: S1C family serine protease [Oscillospiraceae bacterium]